MSCLCMRSEGEGGKENVHYADILSGSALSTKITSLVADVHHCERYTCERGMVTLSATTEFAR
eukprot:1979-Eustigmatos_ZCMA.PRE.1